MSSNQQILLWKSPWTVTIPAPVAGYSMGWNSNDSLWVNNGTDTVIVYNAIYWKVWQWALFVRASWSKINLPAFNLNTASNPWSVSVWINTTTTWAWWSEYSVISRRTWTNTFQLAIGWSISATKISLNDWGASATHIESTNAINDWTWHHIVVTASSNTSAKLYVDWTLNTSSTAFSFVTQSIAFGNNIWNFDTWWRAWDWNIDEVFYFWYELSAAQVTYLYNSGSGRAYPF